MPEPKLDNERHKRDGENHMQARHSSSKPSIIFTMQTPRKIEGSDFNKWDLLKSALPLAIYRELVPRKLAHVNPKYLLKYQTNHAERHVFLWSCHVSCNVLVAAIATYLEDYLEDMDNWWAKNKDHLDSLWMRFSYACITSLPDEPNASSAYIDSDQSKPFAASFFASCNDGRIHGCWILAHLLG
ncbi:hypothetical protein F4604DRAFT_1686803 [Suillus subluteus]|nr:hypothetical protein F4604DRAFT_1686803 [Suillus subluteus]